MIYLSLSIRTWYYGNLQIVFNTPANPFLNQGTKKYLLNFPKKFMEQKISIPRKSFNHPCHFNLKLPPKMQVCYRSILNSGSDFLFMN